MSSQNDIPAIESLVVPMIEAQQDKTILFKIFLALESLVHFVLGVLGRRFGAYYRVTIFGSARLPAEHPICTQTQQLTRELAAVGVDVVTGGGGGQNNGGIMGAANRGTFEANGRGRSFGCTIPLKGEEPNVYMHKVYATGDFPARLRFFGLLGTSFVVMTGGIGSLLELVYVLQIIQLMRHPDKRRSAKTLFFQNLAMQHGYVPALFVYRPAWEALNGVFAQMLKDGTISDGDQNHIVFFDSMEELERLIIEDRKRFIRFMVRKGLMTSRQAAAAGVITAAA